MVTAWTVMFIALFYVGLLFAVASYGDRKARADKGAVRSRPVIYALSLGVYCTSWTYFGSVGLATRTGYDFLAIYIGPILMFVLGWPLLQMVITIAKRQNITSIADFIAARYGKNRNLGAMIAIIAVIGIVPYLSLQLKAVSVSLITMIPLTNDELFAGFQASENLTLLVTVTMAIFAVLFGTRHIDTTEHQDGLILAIAVESVIKLLAFIIVGIFITFWLFGGFNDLVSKAAAMPDIARIFTGPTNWQRWITMTVLAFFAILLLPRQFHTTVVENTSLQDVKKAAWLFPLYLVAINIFVIPIAIAGMLIFQNQSVDADTYVLALPVNSGYQLIAFIAYLGGISAATAMVVMETIALSIMVCNNVVVPEILRRRGQSEHLYGDMGALLIAIRRIAIIIILILAYSYYHLIGSTAGLAQTGLLSFAAVAQFAPAFFIGLFWRKGNAFGAMSGLLSGFIIWGYTLVVPLLSQTGILPVTLMNTGPFDLRFLQPQNLFELGLDPLSNGVFWSLAVNVIVYLAVSRFTISSPTERLQAALFIRPDQDNALNVQALNRTTITVGQLNHTVARYLGQDRAHRAFNDYFATRQMPYDAAIEADEGMLRFSENILASAVGAASSRLVLALLLERQSTNSRGTMQLLDDASAAIQYNRDLLQSAIDHVRQGIAVFDQNLALVCWNRQFRYLLKLPVEMGNVGTPLDHILGYSLSRTGLRHDKLDNAIEERLHKLVQDKGHFQEHIDHDDLVLDIRTSHMPDGGIVMTFADITERVLAVDALQAANETLERRVTERTAELTAMNIDLEQARFDSEAANLGKTRFIAAASHDILQPLNAARLFTASLVERTATKAEGELARNVDSSLEGVEEILTALLEISRLDAGAQKPEFTTVRIDDILTALAREMAPTTQEKGLVVRCVPCSLSIRTDRQLFRRLLQNLAFNAVKYTATGKVLLGCRRQGKSVSIEVHDTGPGIALEQQEMVFQEFIRLEENSRGSTGLGLGLSIVRRIADMLEYPIHLTSKPGQGSVFSVTVPITETVPEEAVADQPGLPSASNKFAHHTVLVVDNEPAIISAMTSLLENWHCHVITAHSVAEAVAQLERNSEKIDIILADYHLHKDDGLLLIASLRARLGRMIPAILITADRSEYVQNQTTQKNVGYLRKPVKPAALRAAMTHNLNQANTAK